MPMNSRALFALCAVSGLIGAGLVTPASAGPPAKAKAAKAKTRTTAKTAATGVETIARAETGYEKGLLGIRVLQSYKVVLARFGQPNRVFRADEYLTIIYEHDATRNEATGGVLDIVSGGDIKENNGNGQAGGNPNNPNNPNSGDGNPDATANPDDENADTSGQNDPANAPGGFNSNQEKKPETFGQAGGFYWVYLFPVTKKAYIFGFNHSGRAELIVETGLGTGMATSRGVSLGSPAKDVFSRYGYPDSTQETDEGIQLFYDIKHHCQFDLIKNRVTTVMVALTEGIKLRISKDKQNAGGGGGGRNGGPPGGGPPGGTPPVGGFG